MTPTDLRQIGEALYGPEWQTPMARSLGVSLRTVQRWASGAKPIPDPDRLRADLLALVPARLAEARERVQAIRQAERMMRRAA